MRVANGPEHGAYFHKYFLRDKPQLAAQMFCKNARTMFAMASDVHEKKNDQEAISKMVQPNPSMAHGVHSNPPNQISRQTFQALQLRTPEAFSLDGFQKDNFLSAFVPMSAPIARTGRNEFLERQTSIMRQEKEQLNRLLVERALRIQKQQLSVAVMQQQNQQDRLLNMRRMMEISMREHGVSQLQQMRHPSSYQQNSDGRRVPTNNRASAA
jgi:hypothetical protein